MERRVCLLLLALIFCATAGDAAGYSNRKLLHHEGKSRSNVNSAAKSSELLDRTNLFRVFSSSLKEIIPEVKEMSKRVGEVFKHSSTRSVDDKKRFVTAGVNLVNSAKRALAPFGSRLDSNLGCSEDALDSNNLFGIINDIVCSTMSSFENALNTSMHDMETIFSNIYDRMKGIFGGVGSVAKAPFSVVKNIFSHIGSIAESPFSLIRKIFNVIKGIFSRDPVTESPNSPQVAEFLSETPIYFVPVY